MGKVRTVGFAALTVCAAFAGELNVQLERRLVQPGAEFSVLLRPDGASFEPADLKSVRLSFPGFRATAAPQWKEGAITLRGRLPQPGLYAFDVSADAGGVSYSVRDFVVATPGTQAPVGAHGGYYVFLGRGDFWEPTHQLANWQLADWERLIEWMEAHRLDTLFTLLNGYTLAYPSEKYPELRDAFAENAKRNFLGELIEFAHRHHVKVYLTLTTDDHARGFGERHPEAVRVDHYGNPRPASALVLENPKVRQYVRDIFSEALELYPRADGIVMHPAENDPERFNRETLDEYRKETGRDFTHEPKDVRYRWYNRKYAEFVGELYRLAIAKNPNLDVIMFNCWWQDNYPALYKEALPVRMRICVWYYGWEDKELVKWPIYKWTATFGTGRVLYMPTSRSFMYPAFRWQEVERHIGTDRLISTADALGIRDVVYFTGWNVGTEEDRLRDLTLSRYPTSSLVGTPKEKQELLPMLYQDYIGARKALLP